MTALFVEAALVEGSGWASNVRVVVNGEGRIADVVVATAPQPGDDVLGGMILLPAPANLHSHAFQRAMAGLGERRGPSGRDSFWTWRALMYRFLERLDPEQVEAIAAMTYVEMLEAGYAAVGEFHYLHHAPDGGHYGNLAEMSLRIAEAASEAGIGLTHLPVLYARGGSDGRPLEGGQRRFGCDMDLFAKLFERASETIAMLPPDASIGLAPHSLRAVPMAMIKEALALQFGPVHIHIAEQTAEVDEIEQAYGARPVRYLMDNVAVNGRWCAIHATHMNPDETEDLARSGAIAGLCPITESNLGDGIFDGARFQESGGAFGIGSDSNVRISLSEELRTLDYSQRLRDRARVVLANADRSAGRTLYDAALAGGAQALGREAGLIEVGAWADLVAIDTHALPLAGLSGDTALDGWIFAGDDRVVRHVWSAGRPMVRDGVHVRRDPIERRFRAVLNHLRETL